MFSLISRPSRHLVALIATLAILVAACGSGDEPASEGIASVDDLETTTTAPPTTDASDDDGERATEEPSAEEPSADDAEADVEADTGALPAAPALSDEPEDISPIEEQELAVLALSACMREEGVENFPDVGVGADGALDLAAVFQAGVDLQSPEFVAALEVCSPLVSDVTFSAAAVPDPTAIADQLFGFTQCLRDEGLDVGDVAVTEILTRQSAIPDNVTDPDEGIAYFFELDPDDPAVRAAIDVCDGELVGLPGAG